MRTKTCICFDKTAAVLALALVLSIATVSPSAAQSPAGLDELLSGIVHIKTFINPDGRTLQNLGREREGSGIVIDDNGLILTIGYLMVEAHAAEVITNAGHDVPANVVGYDHESGFGLLQAIAPLKVQPLAFGKSADAQRTRPGHDRKLRRARQRHRRACVVAKREFAGNWEYCSIRRSSPRRRIRPGAGPRCSTARASWSASAR